MVLLLFPAVTVFASVLVGAAIRVGPNEVIYLPVATQISLIVVYRWLPSQVLPVVSVHTCFFVVVLTPRAPGSLEVEDVKVWVTRVNFVEEVYSYLIFAVSKCTDLTVLTIFHVIWISLTKLAFVLFGVIKFFDPIVRLEATLTKVYTFIMQLTVSNIRTHFRCICPKGSSPILLEIVIKEAPLWVVRLHQSRILYFGTISFFGQGPLRVFANTQKGTRLRLELCQI